MTERDPMPMLDLTAPARVEIDIRADRKVVWINIDGVCRLRACRIGELIVTDQGRKLT